MSGRGKLCPSLRIWISTSVNTLKHEPSLGHYDITVLSFWYEGWFEPRIIGMSDWRWSNGLTVTSLNTPLMSRRDVILSSSRSVTSFVFVFMRMLLHQFEIACWFSFWTLVKSCEPSVWHGVDSSRTWFRTYWSSARRVSPSGSAPYPTTGGGRWDAARSNTGCWSLSDVCRDKIQLKTD